MSSVAPSDSASAATGRKSKPGKAERAARRAATGSEAGAPASAAKAMVFAAAAQTPKPQPGKFPIVFQTGAGEPTRDVTYAVSPKVLASSLSSFVPAFKENPKYAEFLYHTDYTDTDFRKQLYTAALLRLSQQLVHSHVNMGLPQGDFSPVASTEVRVPASVSAFVTQFGEFAIPALGTRYLFKDYSSTVKSLVFAASKLSSTQPLHEILERSWLPVSAHDGHTRVIVADALNSFLKEFGINYQSTELEDAVLSGNRPDNWDAIKPVFGDTDELKNRFDFLFAAQPNAPAFVVEWTKTANKAVLDTLGLSWSRPSAADVDWTFNVKELFTRLADEWAQKSAAYAQFFELASSQANRHAATGSQSQLAEVRTNDGVTVVKTHVGLSAPEFSLVACFPASGVFSGCLVRNVVVTTPLSVKQRATEFIQMDWR